MHGSLRIALVGNPNCGKTALFNLLTGSRQKVANYAGVTVERKEGRSARAVGPQLPAARPARAYSLDAASPDEAITRDICSGRHPDEAAPDLIVCVADATNLRLHLRFVLEVARLGRPMVLALNMMDAARRRGIDIDVAELEQRLGMPVVETVAVRRGGAARAGRAHRAPGPRQCPRRPPGAADADLHQQVRAPDRRRRARAAAWHRASTTPSTAGRCIRCSAWRILAVLMFLIFQAVFSWAAAADGRHRRRR